MYQNEDHKLSEIRREMADAEMNVQNENVDRMNRAQYRDELDHKIKVYDGVKATLKLCKTMIQAMDHSSPDEEYSRKMLISYLELGQSYAMLSSADCEIEKRRVK